MQSITALPIRQHACCAIQQSSCRWLYRVNNWRSLCDCCTQNCRTAWREWVSAAERKLSRLCAPLWPGIRDTRRKKKPLSLWGNRTAEQRGALVPLLRYLLNSNTPLGTTRQEERETEAVHDVTHIHSRQRAPEVERVEQQSDGWSTSRG